MAGDMEIKKIEIRYPAGFYVIGWISIFFGIGLTCFCIYSRFQGNETATVGVMLLFLGLFGSLGAFLVLYGGRRVTLCGTDIVVRNGLARKKVYQLDDIKSVKIRWNGIFFSGRDGLLFKIFDRTMECEQFMRVLEKEGAEIDSPDWNFSRSQREALDPEVRRRRFTVNMRPLATLVLNSLAVFCLFLPFMLMTCLPWLRVFSICWLAAAVLGAAAWEMKRVSLVVQGSRLELYRTFGRYTCYTTGDIKEVRVKPWLLARRSVFGVKVISGEGRQLFRLSCPALGYEDRNYVLALLKYFRDCHVPVKGVERLDEAFTCLLERDYVTEEEGMARSRQVYEGLEGVFKEFVPQFSAHGVTLDYGPLDRERRKAFETGLGLAPEYDTEFWYGVYFCLLRDGRILKMKGAEALLLHGIVLLRGPRGESAEQFLFTPVPFGGIHNILAYLLQQTAKKQVYESDQALDGSLDGRVF